MLGKWGIWSGLITVDHDGGRAATVAKEGIARRRRNTAWGVGVQVHHQHAQHGRERIGGIVPIKMQYQSRYNLLKRPYLTLTLSAQEQGTLNNLLHIPMVSENIMPQYCEKACVYLSQKSV